MSKIDHNKKKCPRCGYDDTGIYCSNCSHPLDKEQTNVFSEMYHSFILKLFHKHHPIIRFIRTWWRAFLRPGTIKLSESYKVSPKYISDIKFAHTVFFMALGTTILKSIFTSTNGSENFIMNWFFQTYFLWIFCFVLLAFIWTGRIWKRWMKMEVKNQRNYDSIYIYEYGFVVTIIYVVSLLWGNTIKEYTHSLFSTESFPELPSQLKWVGIVLLIIFIVHFLWLLLSVGIRAGLPLKKLIFVSILSVYLFPLVALIAELVTIPIVLLPLLFILSPFYYLGRYFYRMIKS